MKYLLDILNIVAIEGMSLIFENLGASNFKNYLIDRDYSRKIISVEVDAQIYFSPLELGVLGSHEPLLGGCF